MELLERAPFLETLATQLEEASRRGTMTLIGGEAGVGKTSLVRKFTEQQRPGVRLLWGACDSQFTPRALGPLADIAEQAGGELEELLLAGASREKIFAGFLRLLREGPRTNLVVLEDIHWADDATLDLLRFVGRRLEASRTLLLATYRSDEVRGELQVVLGDLTSIGSLQRMDLPRLSEPAVATLVRRHSMDPGEVYRTTQGNPFFVTEVLASRDAGVPPSVRDAVLARAVRLSTPARAVIDAAALIGDRVDLALLEQVEAPQPGALEECLAAGLLEVSGSDLVFRHELARAALGEAVAPVRRSSLHRRILEAMVGAEHGTYDPARLAHHAEGADDAGAVIEHATAAAGRAASVDAHREAAAQLDRALRFGSGLSPETLGPMFRARSYERYVMGENTEALADARSALDCSRATGDARAEGDALRWLSLCLLRDGHQGDADAAGREAVEVLEQLPPGRELAMAYSTLSQLGSVLWEHEQAESWGHRAIDLAHRLGDTETMIHALNNVGTSLLTRGDEEGRRLLEESVQAAVDAGLHDHVCRGLSNLMDSAVLYRDFERAERYGDRCLALAEEHELIEHRLYILGWRALAHVMRGMWDEALDTALPIATRPKTPTYVRVMANAVAGRVWARRGDPGAGEALDEALALVMPSEELQWLFPVLTARAEAAWLGGDPGRAAAEIQTVFELARPRAGPWSLGELAFWRWKASGMEPPPEGVAEPYALQMAGDWNAAASRWDELGCPYEAALARADADEEKPLREALKALDELGAEPAYRIVARRLRKLGASAVPRGPRASTRVNPAKLTRRELDVLVLLGDGLRNADIAERLFVSPKTIDHHVSAVLAKLGARTRGEAAREARRLGLLGPER